MNKITLSQLKEQQQISSLDEYENLDLHHEEDVERFKDIFPKSVEVIEKLPTDAIMEFLGFDNLRYLVELGAWYTERNFVAYNSITGLFVIEVRESLNI